jgi:protein O-GlcNAc transferase
VSRQESRCVLSLYFRVLHRAHRLSEAAVCYRAAIRLNAFFHECYTNLGLVLRDLGDLNGARNSFLVCLKLKPTADDFNYLACVCKDLGNNAEAVQHFRNSLRMQSDNVHVYCNLVHSQQMICDWSDYSQRIPALLNIVDYQLSSGQFPSVHPHHSFLYPLHNRTRRAIASAHAKLAEDQARLRTNQQYSFDHLFPLAADQRIRVGYMSSDFKVCWLVRERGMLLSWWPCCH